MDIYDRRRKKRNNEEGWRMDFMKTFYMSCHDNNSRFVLLSKIISNRWTFDSNRDCFVFLDF